MDNYPAHELEAIRGTRMETEERHRPDKWDEDLQAIQRERIALDSFERKIIWRLRIDQGESWSDIGRRLGISKQAAWERFGKPFPTQGGLAPGPGGSR